MARWVIAALEVDPVRDPKGAQNASIGPAGVDQVLQLPSSSVPSKQRWPCSRTLRPMMPAATSRSTSAADAFGQVAGGQCLPVVVGPREGGSRGSRVPSARAGPVPAKTPSSPQPAARCAGALAPGKAARGSLCASSSSTAPALRWSVRRTHARGEPFHAPLGPVSNGCTLAIRTGSSIRGREKVTIRDTGQLELTEERSCFAPHLFVGMAEKGENAFRIPPARGQDSVRMTPSSSAPRSKSSPIRPESSGQRDGIVTLQKVRRRASKAGTGIDLAQHDCGINLLEPALLLATALPRRWPGAAEPPFGGGG